MEGCPSTGDTGDNGTPNLLSGPESLLVLWSHFPNILYSIMFLTYCIVYSIMFQVYCIVSYTSSRPWKDVGKLLSAFYQPETCLIASFEPTLHQPETWCPLVSTMRLV